MANGILRFEWDSKKAASNLRKHRVSFEEAALIFNDEFATFYEDPDLLASRTKIPGDRHFGSRKIVNCRLCV